MESLYPLRFHPVYKDYLWGGSRIPERFDRDLPEGVYAESWEISTHPDGPSVIANGPLAGKTFSDLVPKYKIEWLGSRVMDDDFPLLIKVIDAREKLSVQVHPNDHNAVVVNGDPKTEMWYFLDGDPGAEIYCGLKPGVGRPAFLKAIKEKTFADILQTIPVDPGGAVFVPGGCVHAIGQGSLILEIQQNSNTTYRIYDWDRTDGDGNSRELHIDKALQVIDWENNRDPRCEPCGTTIHRCEHFQLDRHDITDKTSFTLSGKSFHALFIEKGTGGIRWATGEESFVCGQSWFVPAGLGDYEIISDSGVLTVLKICVP